MSRGPTWSGMSKHDHDPPWPAMISCVEFPWPAVISAHFLQWGSWLVVINEGWTNRKVSVSRTEQLRYRQVVMKDYKENLCNVTVTMTTREMMTMTKRNLFMSDDVDIQQWSPLLMLSHAPSLVSFHWGSVPTQKQTKKFTSWTRHGATICIADNNPIFLAHCLPDSNPIHPNQNIAIEATFYFQFDISSEQTSIKKSRDKLSEPSCRTNMAQWACNWRRNLATLWWEIKFNGYRQATQKWSHGGCVIGKTEIHRRLN